MTTPLTDTLPKIFWTRADKVEFIEGTTVYNGFGESQDGRLWIADWNEILDEVEIENIEEA